MSKSQNTVANRGNNRQYDNNYELVNMKLKRNRSKKKPSGERHRNRSTPKWDPKKHGEVTRSLPSNAVLNRLVQSKESSSINRGGRQSKEEQYKLRVSHSRNKTGEPKKTGTRSTYLTHHAPNSVRGNYDQDGRSNNARSASRNASFISGGTQSRRKDASPTRDSGKYSATLNAIDEK